MAGGDFFADQMIEQKTFLRFVRPVTERPATRGLTNRIPGPHRTGFNRFAEPAHATHAPMFGFDPDPVTILEAIVGSDLWAHKQGV